MDEWSQVLEKRFKTPFGQAWSNLDNTRYTLANVRGKRSVSAYMSSLVSAAKQCGETQEYPMVLRAWKDLDLPLRRTIDEPIEGTTIKDFMELLVMKQSTRVSVKTYVNMCMNSSLALITHHLSLVDPPTILIYSTLPSTPLS